MRLRSAIYRMFVCSCHSDQISRKMKKWSFWAADAAVTEFGQHESRCLFDTMPEEG